MAAIRVVTPAVRQKVPWVKVCELFVELPYPIYNDILSTGAFRECCDGQVIFRRGDPVGELLLLTHGRAKMTQLDRNGNEVILRLSVPGEIIGRPIWESGDVHSFTAQAIEECRMVAWKRATFDALLDRYPVLLRNATRIVAQQLQELQGRFCELATENVAARLAGVILRLIGQMGHRETQEIKVTQQILAQMIGTDVWAVNRVLSVWERQGLVSVRRKVIAVQNYERLLCAQEGS